MKEINELLHNPRLRLMQAKYNLSMENSFESDLCGWAVTDGEWHKMTIDSNADNSAGLDGEAKAFNTAGSYDGGSMEKTVWLNNYGEISFEHYVQNNEPYLDDQYNVIRIPNYLRFYVDGILKLEIEGPSPWYRCAPIGLPPGRHHLKFEYDLNGGKRELKKAVVDTITIHEAKDIKCIINSYYPPTPVKGLADNKILRGFSVYQEMVESDTKIEFTAIFQGKYFHEFMINNDKIYYFLDEFGVCYRGSFPEMIEPKSIALGEIYGITLTMIAGQKTGVGFC